MIQITSLPFAASNSYLSSSQILLSIGDGLFATTWDWDEPILLRRFEGAGAGLRLIHRTVRGTIIVSPWGKELPDTEKGLWRGTNNGESWSRVLSLDQFPNRVGVWAFTEDLQGRLFAGVYLIAPGECAPNIYRSIDDGLSWSLVYRDSTGRHIHHLAVDHKNGSVYASVGDSFSPWKTRRVIRSDDAGDSWHPVLDSLPQVVPVLPVGSVRFLGTDEPNTSAILITNDDNAWKSVFNARGQEYFYWMRHVPASGRILVGTAAGQCESLTASLYASLPCGLDWEPVLDLMPEQAYDGSQHASNVLDTRLIVHRLRNGKVVAPLLVESSNEIPSPSRRYKAWLFSQRLWASLILGLISPLLLVATLGTIVTLGEKPFYVQVRRGKDGKRFRIWKLRSMRPPASGMTPEDRITPFGSVLRRLSIDELPQLVNVIRGEMALVGPRPHPIELDDSYACEFPDLFRRYEALPGMTGLAQLRRARGPIDDRESMQRRLRLDFDYLRTRSVWGDIRLLGETLALGFFDRK